MKTLKLLTILLLLPSLCFGAASRSFDGVNDNISMGNVLDVTTGNVSLCIWAKPTESANSEQLIGKKSGVGASLAGYVLQRESTTDLISMRASDGAQQGQSNSTTDIDGVWGFACGTFTAPTETTTIAINNVQEDSDITANIDSLTNAVNFQSGEQPNALNDYTGLLAYGMQFSAVISVVEMAELMWKPESIVINTPNGFWPFWGDATEIDLSANDNTGTVTGATTSSDGPPVFFGSGLPL